MATKEDPKERMRRVLTQATGWYYRPAAPMVKRRRPVFHLGDIFSFRHDGANLRLKVVDTDNVLVLGEELKLAWREEKTAFFTEDYGREMSFIVTGSESTGWTMVYGGVYLSSPHHGPDEGGDGDPR